jgi:hypothetical protein
LNSEFSYKLPVEYFHQYGDELRKRFIPEQKELRGERTGLRSSAREGAN